VWYSAPTWMNLSLERRASLRFIWDDTRASLDFRSDVSWVLDAADEISTRAQLVLCVGLYEWVRWRFEGLHADPRPGLVAEAAWCATLDPRYMVWFELDRDEWTGPIRGPLWCAVTWLQPALTRGDEEPEQIADALDYLTRLGLHVVPEPERLAAWLRAVLPRLATHFPAEPEEPFEDPFEEHTGERRGALVGPQALDPSIPYDSHAARTAFVDLLAMVRRANNPFIATPE
jgi:hypothetical protein